VLLCVLALPSALAAYGAVRLAQLDAGEQTAAITVGVVQANVSHYDRLADEVGTFEAVRRILDPHFALSSTLLEQHELDLLVWPETVYPTSFGAPKSADGAAFDRAIGALVAQSGVPLLFGTYERDGDAEYNVAVLLEATSEARVTFDSYRKSNLFPFTEYVPAWLESDWLRARLPWAGRWKPGSGAQVLHAALPAGDSLSIAPLICYDAIDPGFVAPAVRQGAALLATLSNDSWFAYPGVQRLILILSAFRSIEMRRPQIRATPTGVSAVISATGALTDLLDVNRRGTLVASIVPARDAWTPMVALGNWLPPAALLAALALLALAARR
jgi:apolipoprotein N-acyltransferase